MSQPNLFIARFIYASRNITGGGDARRRVWAGRLKVVADAAIKLRDIGYYFILATSSYERRRLTDVLRALAVNF